MPRGKMKKVSKRPVSDLAIDCELGLNNLYLPLDKKFMNKPDDPDSFPCQFVVDKKDKKTIDMIVNKLKEFAVYAENEKKSDLSAQELLIEASKSKFVDGEQTNYEGNLGKRVLKTNCYEARPATGRIVNGKVEVEDFGDKEGKRRGLIQRGDKVRAVLNFYHIKNPFHDKLMVRVLAVYQVSQGTGSFVANDTKSRGDRALKILGLEASDAAPAVSAQNSDNLTSEENEVFENTEPEAEKKGPGGKIDVDAVFA